MKSPRPLKNSVTIYQSARYRIPEDLNLQKQEHWLEIPLLMDSKVVRVYAMKAHDGVEVQIHSFSTWPLENVNGQLHAPDPWPPVPIE